MLVRLAKGVLPILQLTRIALVFTAIADSTCAMLLWADASAPDGVDPISFIDARRMGAIWIVSIGLYAFGMSLNDIIDRRRDSQLAPTRPLPSGRIGIVTAHVICILFALAALIAGAYLAIYVRGGWMSLILIVFTGGLIALYDFAGKYLVWIGLLVLGLIRFFHALIAAPYMPMIWHPLLLLHHIAILSTVAYALEQKRPPLTALHWWAVGGGLLLIDVVVIGLLGFLSGIERLRIDSALALPIGSMVLFVVIALGINLTSTNSRRAGQTMMLYGLLWLIVYDAAFVSAYVSMWIGVLMLMLLPTAWLAVQAMRWSARLLQTDLLPPTFKREERV